MSWIRYVIYITLIILLSGICIYTPDWVSTGLSYLSYPVVCLQYPVYRSVSTIASWCVPDDTIRQERDAYRDLCDDLRAENIRLTSQRAYAHAVEEVASFARRYHAEYGTIARIILRQCTAYRHICLLNVGSRHGVQPDMIVVYKHMLVGRIEQVYPYYSRVRLITDATCHVPAECAVTGARGIHRGNNDNNASSLMYVNHLTSVQPGDMVMTRAHGLVYPSGFGIGRVASYTTDDVHHNVYIYPYINIYDIEHCYVIQPGSEYDASISS